MKKSKGEQVKAGITETTTRPEPRNLSVDLIGPRPESVRTLRTIDHSKSMDLLQEIKLDQTWKFGQWSREDKLIVSPKGYGVRIELPSVEADEYRIQMLVEPLDAPNALLVGNRSSGNRFASLFGFVTEQEFESQFREIYEQIIAYAAGAPINMINPRVWNGGPFDP